MTPHPENIWSCRLCDESNDKMYSVLETNELNIEIIKIIQDCLPILIYEDDPLSKHICHSCNLNLNMFCEFKKSCTDTARKHREDLEAREEKTASIEKFLSKMRDYEESDSFNEQFNGEATSQVVKNLESNVSTVKDKTAEESLQNGCHSQCSADCGSPIQYKPRISGPRSKTNQYTQLVKTMKVIKQPLDLLELVVQHFNVQNIAEFEISHSTDEIILEDTVNYSCRYCELLFDDEAKLAVHELDVHIQLHLARVDEDPCWSGSKDEHPVTNAWMEVKEEGAAAGENANVNVENFEDDGKDLLVPIEEKGKQQQEADPPMVNTSRECEIYFVDEEPYARGVPLKDVPKEVRNTFYQAVRMFGAKKKFCQLCRYTYKDNWSMDNHFFQGNCYYTCFYCGLKFKRNKVGYRAHVADHEAAGHKQASCVFSMRGDSGTVVKYDTTCLEPYIPQVPYVPRTKLPPPTPSPMKLRVRQLPTESPPPPPAPAPPPPPASTRSSAHAAKAQHSNVNRKSQPTENTTQNQAYFCKKCYQVFVKLGSYNNHVLTCNGELDDPEMSLMHHYAKKGGSPAEFASKLKQPPSNMNRRPNTRKLPDLKPLQHSHIKIKQENGISIAPPPPVEHFPCNYCKSVFKTIYSRNSHMRIHVRNKETLPVRHVPVKRSALSAPQYVSKKVKQESNFEPIVEIHEGATTTIGSVSITPIKRTITAVSMSPDVLKLVQNNPNITLQPRSQNLNVTKQQFQTSKPSSQKISTPKRSPAPGDDIDSGKGYNCASCYQHFNNKSSLYFHKKDQCTGSRYPCPFCKKRFGTSSEYSAHVYYNHPE